MASISGSNTSAAVQVATTWGTGVAAGSGDRFSGEITVSANGTVLESRTIGSGAYMRSNFTRGAYIPTASLTADLGYRNNCDVLIAAFMGTAGAPTEVTASQADYKHTITFNSTLNAKYVSFGYTDTNSTSLEFPTAAVRSIGIRSTSVPGYVDFTAELLGSSIVFPGTTNTYAVVAATTFTEGTPELVAVALEDAYRTNAQSGGSIASGNLYSITGFDFSMTRPQDLIPEIKGSTGFSAPVSSGVAEGTFNITVKELADQAYYTVWLNETAQKASIDIQGTQIGSGTNKTFKLLLPRLLLVQEPQYAVTGDGVNTLGLNFNIAVAGSNPTGMTSTYPYFEITNGLSTSLLA
ncbi:MAG: hypothetical protein E6R03_09690 [Hyphomicrobiaceae bacterium]|nr:MAG: hypothetical protein E6R03_09690 [Hyphomicrobiaceae bacterium]